MAKTKTPADNAAELCRVVVLQESTGRWDPRTDWQPENDALHDLAQRLCTEGLDAHVVARPQPVQGPAHTPAADAKPGERVVRYSFADGSTADMTLVESLTQSNNQLRRFCQALQAELARTSEQIERAISDRTLKALEKKKMLSDARMREAARIYNEMDVAQRSKMGVDELQVEIGKRMEPKRSGRQVFTYLTKARELGLLQPDPDPTS